MFRTGHKNDPIPAEPERRAVEPVPAERAVAAAPEATAPALPAWAAPQPGARDAVIGRGVTFDGTLRFSGTLTIDGSFTGHILDGDTLVIGAGATVKADVSCGAIEVFGEVQGSLTATRAVELRAAARVNADVTTPSLRIADGALLDGMVKMRGASTRTKSERPKRRERDVAAAIETPREESVPTG